ncbi:unnamed protein product [Paramecium primaurelia]|uniref:Uncharacterized protein n=1 Tax=Paramecium primaurelia TaxID=5886 RepID=A0A8S1L2A5_PARPR|nr:unnamed protein product [Paramecium primaurelia]
MANILQVYEQCINNPEILRHGDQYLSEYLKNTPNFILESLKLIFDVNQQQRKYIAILFKNVILLNWQHLQQQIKSDILKVLVDGLQQEQQVPVQEIITIIITEVMRRDPEYQSLIPQFLHLYTQNPHIINTLIHIYQQLDGQNLISYCEIILQNMLSQQSPTSKTYNLVYQVIKMFSHCEQTDIEQLKQCFDSTFIQWMERFSQHQQPQFQQRNILQDKEPQLIQTSMPQSKRNASANRKSPMARQKETAHFCQDIDRSISVEKNKKNNKTILKNAITYVCMAGEPNKKEREAILQKLDGVEAEHFIILFKTYGRSDFRGLYGYAVDSQPYFIFGQGKCPQVLTSEMVKTFFKYDSGAKQFKAIDGNKQFTIMVDAVQLRK